MSNEFHLYLSHGYCLFMLVLALVIRKFPPKKINPIYGYRTRRSMMNQQTWDAANTYSTKGMINIAVWSLGLAVVTYYIYPEITLWVTIIVNTLLLFVVIFSTENYLKKHFDESGNPK
jgi:uncharacterized membrane protein